MANLKAGLLLLPLVLIAACGGEDPADLPEAEFFLKSHPENPQAWSEAAGYRMGVGDWKGAAEAFEKVIEFDPQDAFSYAYLAVAYAHLGQSAKAQTLAQQAAAIADEANDAERLALEQWMLAWEAEGFAPEIAFKLGLGSL